MSVGLPRITHHCCPQLRQPGLLHILLVTLPSSLYSSAHALFLHWVLIPPFLCLKATLNSTLPSEGSTNSKARCTRPPSHLLAPACLSTSSLFFAAIGLCLPQHLLCIVSLVQQMLPSHTSHHFLHLMCIYTSPGSLLSIQALPFARNSLSHPICLGSRYLFLSLQLRCQLFPIASLDTPFTHPHTPRQNYFGLPSSFMHSAAVAVATLHIYTA